MQTELFEIELIMCIKMDLVLNNLQRLICHKTQLIDYQNNSCACSEMRAKLNLVRVGGTKELLDPTDTGMSKRYKLT